MFSAKRNLGSISKLEKCDNDSKFWELRQIIGASLAQIAFRAKEDYKYEEKN